MWISLVVLAFSSFTAVISELISWFAVYRTQGFKDKMTYYQKVKRRVDTMKKSDKALSSSKKSNYREKQINKETEELDQIAQSLQMYKMFSGLIHMVVMFIFNGIFNVLFEGVVVAHLPFEPIKFVQWLSHRGLMGDDTTECCNTFLYFLSSFSIRANIQRIMGLSVEIPSWSGQIRTPTVPGML
ncbi:putative Transmembrane and coiled-coil domains protein 1 [Monocercomonoides exilis]|uniref:putative Transmembrane and coiled-coil domains protein 1 n=1 Tax=Monocercomonoides exilis TaxID=2049356 RepID=UPI00355ACBEB|nr:putative Transmembrane and coiled-coil domains protein 1 [Monocercomonoides exilis]|eukprot:MONOS_9260.1-p1 / transcript=MONOS_9260.1 / gene=MONOS_9260 / organism=Monocercomonoides_exilis_PA203 / gene_product=Transmembrane and coiled-coil domains protein 1 / transcript_product=Transmembrane and coiled-coil domains protein 1 / location=Mono_scaffold00375:47965-48632(+) / protein_length=184 / sequence_SO=supercontig / SO=protein_coding / is_pseudo=false